jgi:hypothetical protein
MKDKHGNTVDIGYTFEHEGRKLVVYDISDGSVIASEPSNPKVRMTFAASTLGMVGDTASSKEQKRRKFIEARLKLRSYWED